MGSDADEDAIIAALEVSIRAPAWGATLFLTIAIFASPVSIRAPAWGATCGLFYDWLL